MMDIQQKAINACKAYSDCNKKIKRLGNEIGDYFNACHAQQEKDLKEGKETSKKNMEPHLFEFYGVVGISWEGEDVYYKDSQIKEKLEEIGCSHCLAAHNAIQERKKTRIALSAAKRAITMIGRKA